MIRPYTNQDLDAILDIWFSSNLEAHNFIASSFWVDNLKFLEREMPNAEVYIYEVDNKVIAFMGINDSFIEGIFVSEKYRSQNIGKQLIDYGKKIYPVLSLFVYCKNKKAVAFYEREKFKPITKRLNDKTKEEELLMRYSLEEDQLN